MFVDLAAVDRNASVIQNFADRQNWNVRPALKAFQCPQLCAYVMRRLPKPRGLVFRLRQVDQIMTAAPAGTDLMMGYPSTSGELRWFLGSQPPSGQRSYTLTILASSLENIEDLAGLARTTKASYRSTSPWSSTPARAAAGLFSSRRSRRRSIPASRKAPPAPRRATLCYDGWATLTGDQNYRLFVANTASDLYRSYLAQLKDEGGDLYNPKTLIRNGPASSKLPKLGGQARNQRDQPGIPRTCTPATSRRSTTKGSSVRLRSVPRCSRTSAHIRQDSSPRSCNPRSPLTRGTCSGRPGPTAAAPSQRSYIRPASQTHACRRPRGHRCTNGALSVDDYVLLWPNQSGEGVDYFGSLHAYATAAARRVADVQRPTDLQ